MELQLSNVSDLYDGGLMKCFGQKKPSDLLSWLPQKTLKLMQVKFAQPDCIQGEWELFQGRVSLC